MDVLLFIVDQVINPQASSWVRDIHTQQSAMAEQVDSNESEQLKQQVQKLCDAMEKEVDSNLPGREDVWRKSAMSSKRSRAR